MIPTHMLDKANDQHRLQFFEKSRNMATGREEWAIKQDNTGSNRAGSSKQQAGQSEESAPKQIVVPSRDPISSLTEVIRAETHRKKKYPPSETGNSPKNYELFVDLIHRMLAFDPQHRIKPEEALRHPFITSTEHQHNEYEGQPHHPDQLQSQQMGHAYGE
jgi:serine/threonine protein kinase